MKNIEQTMSSLEISELTGKRHDNVMRDIENILTEAKIDFLKFEEREKYGNNNERTIYNLPRFECDLVVSGYSVQYRAKIIKRWHELEKKQLELSESPFLMIAQMATATEELHQELKQTALEVNEVKETQENMITKGNERFSELKTQVNHIQINSQNGIPMYHRSKTEAFNLYNFGISPDAFHKLLHALGTPTQRYNHTENGYTSNTYAYREPELGDNITKIKLNRVQKSTNYCVCDLPETKNIRFMHQI